MELLVILGAIGLLVALLLPAVQWARESSRNSASHRLAARGNEKNELCLGLESLERARRAGA